MTAEAPERRLARRLVFDGRVIRVFVDEVERPDGTRATREVVDHPGAVAVLPLKDERTAVLLRQYRHAVGGALLEIPAGRLEAGEQPLDAAQRELREETGFRARVLRPIASVYATPGFCNERVHLFLAQGLEEGESAPEEDEHLELVLVDADEARRLLQTGGVEDAKTLAALLWWLGPGTGGSW